MSFTILSIKKDKILNISLSLSPKHSHENADSSMHDTITTHTFGGGGMTDMSSLRLRGSSVTSVISTNPTSWVFLRATHVPLGEREREGKDWREEMSEGGKRRGGGRQGQDKGIIAHGHRDNTGR